MRIRQCLLAAVLLAAGPVAARADYIQEDWNSPTLRENGWFYWNENNGQPPPDNHVAMNWDANGGIGDSGHVHTDLGLLTPHHDETRAYYPAFNTTYLTPAHYINLTIADAAVRIWLSDMTPPLTPNINFHGGMLTIFLGVWEKNNPTIPADDEWAFFYNNHGVADAAIPDYWTGMSRWSEFTFPVGDDSDWSVLDISADPPVTQASQLFHHPQQWGFMILDDPGPPSGVLAFDGFSIVPEPATLSLLALGGLALLRRTRK